MHKYRNLFPAVKDATENEKQIKDLYKLRDIARENNEVMEAAMIEKRIIELKMGGKNK